MAVVVVCDWAALPCLLLGGPSVSVIASEARQSRRPQRAALRPPAPSRGGRSPGRRDCHGLRPRNDRLGRSLGMAVVVVCDWAALPCLLLGAHPYLSLRAKRGNLVDLSARRSALRRPAPEVVRPGVEIATAFGLARTVKGGASQWRWLWSAIGRLFPDLSLRALPYLSLRAKRGSLDDLSARRSALRRPAPEVVRPGVEIATAFGLAMTGWVGASGWRLGRSRAMAAEGLASRGGARTGDSNSLDGAVGDGYD